MLVAMLTTIDNPHDPFDDYDNWFAFDSRLGYHTPSYLARIVITSDSISDVDQQLAINEAVDKIVEQNINFMYKKVEREVLVE
jgi:hypothetical protein